MSPGSETPLHSHDKEEVTWIHEGKLWDCIGEEEAAIGVGDVMIVPPHTLHQLKNVGEAPVIAMAALPIGTKFFRGDGREDTPPHWLE